MSKSNDDITTAARSAAVAAKSEKIADDTVGIGELMDILGASDLNPVSGTSHFESVSVERASINHVLARTGPESNQDIDTDTRTQIKLDSADSDVIEDSDVVPIDMTNHVFVIEESGTYRIHGFVGMDTSGGRTWIDIRLNGSRIAPASRLNDAEDLPQVPFSYEDRLSEGDEISIHIEDGGSDPEVQSFDRSSSTQTQLIVSRSG